jgi:glycolate oxidase iron-sulfur subunit
VLRDDPVWAERAAQVAGLARDVSEVIGELELAPTGEVGALTVAYHSACSLQHGQKIHDAPRDLLAAAGFDVRDVAEGHLCCGSAGTYNLLQPDLAARLLERKAANIRRLGADVVAAGNIGCMTQIGGALDIPVVHTVELLDWATGGPKPAKMG